MDLNAPIDLYCERLAPGLWAEPLNALSNLAFIAAALWAWSAARRRGVRDRALYGLIGLIGLIGVGSGLFHTFANRWSQAADVLPIGLFVLGYLTLALRRFFQCRWGATALWLASFIGLSAAVGALLPRSALGGGGAYLPVIAALSLMTWQLARRRHSASPWIAWATVAFALSFTCRTLDGPLCDAWPVGTHWAWHLLNAAVLGLLTWGALVSRGDPLASRGDHCV